ncbi:cytochrome ubiquinol oxidase subunit I [Hazenella sp. IB182357]|uniref:Cytochrome ubiquinol oxidase subunit I n=1 Tax=Polycladospora coralii TaxID=2771432 RepID=A0A926NH38_9BACL|nr:cytochrome ubiquinol oxidase subunit I [Polycladospora coralii]MBD1373464.1 cytochrome ubiquinol oxidase subunit I [Polycladospora coralii]MBS7531241.1 cytochrome ubiquinol oxidase subunit I [Polycladospora coralii]
MDTVTLSRAFFGTSLAFHIIFATLGIGISFMVFLSEVMHQLKKDNDYAIMAKRWTKSVAILLGVAIPSGTIVAVQLSLLWPGFMKIVGEVISVPFQVEIFAFFLEALALSIYVYAADRLPPNMRILSVFLVFLGAIGSAILITSANTWMNTPAGFDMAADGTIYNVDPWKAFFNPSFLQTSYHVSVSALMVGAFAVASVAAYRLLKRDSPPQAKSLHYKALTLSLVVAFFMSLLTALSGHGSGQNLQQHNPEKLAAAEGLFETQRYAPLAIGGYVDPETHKVKYGIEIPYLLSFIAGNRFDTEVKGLYEFPEETWPPFYVHTLFNVMVGIGTLLLLLAGLGLYYRWKKKRHYPKWLLRSFIFSGPLAMLGIEFGWIFSCSGRQPWTIYGYQTTAEAATRAAHVGFLLILFAIVYAVLSVLVTIVMISYFKRHPVMDDIEQFSKSQVVKGG